MAKTPKDPTPPPPPVPATPALVEDELKDSYLNYAMSVIVARALPDVRDGLKPSQRRILVAMHDLNLGAAAKFRKCAKIAGDTSGNYHPHGEQVVYPTLVRLAQDFNMRYLLVQGQGNFGSIDGDPPAAMRYTEARMTAASVAMLEDLDKNTVDFVPNYDESREEPTVLPSKFPNLICNGSMGIAVGMATSIPPHNVTEVCDGILHLLSNPACTVEDLMKIVKGPDFPTGGIICGLSGIRQGFQTGRALLRVRGRVKTEETRGKLHIVITEIPYNVQKSRLIERIADLVKVDTLKGVSDVRDESDRDGMRIVVDLSKGQDADIVLNQLYASTPLQETFSVNAIALVNGRPQVLNLKDLLSAFVDHRKVVIRRRTKTLLDQALADEHILAGLAKALDVLDEVIATIRASKNPEVARASLEEKFGFTTLQAEAILRLTLQRLTGLEREKILADLEALRKKIAEYRAILRDEALVLDIIREDMHELKEKFGDARRTEISAQEAESFDVEELIPEEDMAVVLTHQGYIKRVTLASYRRQRRGGRGVIAADMREADFVESLFIANTHDTLLFFTDLGRVHWLKVHELPQMERSARGKTINSLLQLQKDERIAASLAVRSYEEGFLVMATRGGVAKKTALSAFSNPRRGGIIAIGLREGDRVIGVKHTSGEDEMVLATSKGFAVRFHEKHLRPMGRAATGVCGVKLGTEDFVVDLGVVRPEGAILTICERGYGKRSKFEEYRVTRRAGKGITNVKVTEKNGRVIGVRSVTDADEVMVITQAGMVIRTPVKGVALLGRRTQGVRIVKLDEGDKVVSIARVEPEKEEGEAPESPRVVQLTDEERREAAAESGGEEE